MRRICRALFCCKPRRSRQSTTDTPTQGGIDTPNESDERHAERYTRMDIEAIEAGPVDWELARQWGLGQECTICGDERQCATHVALCGHSACESCWAQWPSACMFCNRQLGANDIIRAPLSVVPDGPAEAPVDRTLALVDAAGTQAINHFVAIKQQLTSMQAALELMAEHLRGLSPQGHKAVLQVAAFQILEHPAASLTHMDSIFGKCTDAVHEATRTIKDARSGVGAALDWVSVCHAQWAIAQAASTQVKQLIVICISVISQGQLDEEVLMSLATSMSSLEAAFSMGGDAVNESLQELDSELLNHRNATEASGDIVIGEVFHECDPSPPRAMDLKRCGRCSTFQRCERCVLQSKEVKLDGGRCSLLR